MDTHDNITIGMPDTTCLYSASVLTGKHQWHFVSVKHSMHCPFLAAQSAKAYLMGAMTIPNAKISQHLPENDQPCWVVRMNGILLGVTSSVPSISTYHWYERVSYEADTINLKC